MKVCQKRAQKSALHALQVYLKAEQCQNLWCFTDPDRLWLAEAFSAAGKHLGLASHVMVFPGERYSSEDLRGARALLQGLGENALVLSVFSGRAATTLPYPELLPNLRSPEGFAGLSGCIRQRYADEVLLQHLLTDRQSVEDIVARYSTIGNSFIRLTAPGGTDLVCQLTEGKVLPYAVDSANRHAYLPPSEFTFGIAPETAEGIFVCDITVGEFAVRGKGVVDPMGTVNEPVRLCITRGSISDINGGQMATRLSRQLSSAQQDVKKAVELGFGLSRGAPTGQIGPDESLQGTFHLGFGNDLFYGGTNDVAVHLDLVAAEPSVTPHVPVD